MSTENTKLDETTNNKVKTFVEDIVTFIKDQEEVEEGVMVDFINNVNADNTLHAMGAVITTKFGMVTVFPDFGKKKAHATIVNLGVINAMQQEGFDEDYIQSEGPIYGALLEYSKKNVKILGTYLSCKMDFSKS